MHLCLQRNKHINTLKSAKHSRSFYYFTKQFANIGHFAILKRGATPPALLEYVRLGIKCIAINAICEREAFNRYLFTRLRKFFRTIN